MHTKRRTVLTLAAVCVAALPFAGAGASTSTAAPLMPTKDPVAHRVTMQDYTADRLSSDGGGAMVMTPLMPTKDRMAHQASRMQAFSWFEPYGASGSEDRPDHAVGAPLMPTKDPSIHRG